MLEHQVVSRGVAVWLGTFLGGFVAGQAGGPLQTTTGCEGSGQAVLYRSISPLHPYEHAWIKFEVRFPVECLWAEHANSTGLSCVRSLK